MDKSELRAYMRQRKKEMREAMARTQDAAPRLMLCPQFARASVAALFRSLPDEPGTLGALLAPRAVTLLPVIGASGRAALALYEGEERMRVGEYGIMEPCGAPYDDYGSVEVIVVPGVAFDRLGGRIGRGKGYYDRLLPQLRHAYRIGLCFDFQIVDSVPADENDATVDEVIAVPTVAP